MSLLLLRDLVFVLAMLVFGAKLTVRGRVWETQDLEQLAVLVKVVNLQFLENNSRNKKRPWLMQGSPICVMPRRLTVPKIFAELNYE